MSEETTNASQNRLVAGPKQQTGPQPIVAADVPKFKIKITSGKEVGWVGEESGLYGILVPDEADAIIFNETPYQGQTYLQVYGGDNYLSWNGRYAYVEFVFWIRATGWAFKNGKLVSQDGLAVYNGANSYGDPGLYVSNDGGDLCEKVPV